MRFRKLKNVIKSYLIKWWLPLLLFIPVAGFFFLGIIFQRDFIIKIFILLFFVNTIGTVISAIYNLIKIRLFISVFQILILILIVYYVGVIFLYSPPDYFATHKKIPADIDFLLPLENMPNAKDFDNTDLILENSFQPGIYHYYTDFNFQEYGDIYLKAYEITSNHRLSKNRIEVKSRVRIEDLNKKWYEGGEFIIYEGEWGEKYGARIELWFAPQNNKSDYKLTERNFIIEGWMR